MADAILVFGGAGYIGSHTCKALHSAGLLPVVYDNLSTGHGYAVKWGPFIQGDLNDTAKLDAAFKTYAPKAVIHFAANAIVLESMADPGKYYHNNVGGTVALLEAMRHNNVKKIVFSSTCACYGNPLFHPITEKHPIQPMSPYGKSKWMCEEILRDFERAYDFEPTLLRYFNAAGADLETQIGENHTPETHLIPRIIQTALGLREEICVYGTDFASKDGSAVRDYVHVMDLASAHVMALAKPKCTVNIGAGTGFSVLEIIQAVQQFCGKPIEVKLENRREGEPGVLCADNTKAKELLSWNPRFSDLPTIVESAWKWHQLLHENAHLVKSVLKC